MSKTPTPTIVNIPLTELHETFFVRKTLNQEHAIHLGLLYSSGVVLPPLKVCHWPDDLGTGQHWEIVDGRHRRYALSLNNIPDAPCVVVDEESKVNLLLDAAQANFGGSQPMTDTDITFTITQLLNEGMSERRIMDNFEARLHLPRKLVKQYVDNAAKEIQRVKLTAAKNDVLDRGYRLSDAAAKYKLEPDDLRRAMANKKDRGGRSIKTDTPTRYTGAITNRYRSLGIKNAALFKRLICEYELGDLRESFVQTVLDHAESSLDAQTKSLTDWKRRFEAAKRRVQESSTSAA